MPDFEGIEFSPDNNLDDKGLDEIEVLVIDILSLPFTISNNEDSDTFYISLGLIEKAKEMATNLTNRSFSHFLMTISNILLNHISSANVACDIFDTNIFDYIATNPYSSGKFYEIMINTGISKHFTSGYE